MWGEWRRGWIRRFLNDGRLTTVDADGVVVRGRHRHRSDVDFLWMHEGIFQRGRLRRLERFRAHKWAFQPAPKKGNFRGENGRVGNVKSSHKPGTWADWAAPRSTVRLIIHVMHNCRRHFLYRRLNFGRCDRLLEFLVSFWLLLHWLCQSGSKQGMFNLLRKLRVHQTHLSCGVRGWLSFSWLLHPK